MSGIQRDPCNTPVQGFAPRKIVTITATEAWEPTDDDIAFRVPGITNYFMSTTGAGHETGLLAGSITVIATGVTSYTFDTTMELEVM